MNSNQVARVSKNSNKSQSPSKKKKTFNNEVKEIKENDTIKSENPKTKLLNALNNINDEINVVIDSKDKLINNNLNLDVFIKKKSSKSSSSIKSPDKFVNIKQNIKNKYISPITDKEDEKPIIKTETSNDNRNLRKINKIISKDIIENIKTEPRQYNKYINSSQSSQISKSKNSEFNNINSKISRSSFQNNIVYTSKQDKEIKIENYIDSKNKLTLHNLNTEDKILIKDMEDKNALMVSDVSSLNKKNVTNYNITISNFKIQKILEYYFCLVNEYEKEKNENIELENEVTELKSRYLEMKKNEMSTNSRGRESDRLNNSTIRTISVGKYGPLSRYQNDLNYFKDLIVKMNDEIKNT